MEGQVRSDIHDCSARADRCHLWIWRTKERVHEWVIIYFFRNGLTRILFEKRFIVYDILALQSRKRPLVPLHTCTRCSFTTKRREMEWFCRPEAHGKRPNHLPIRSVVCVSTCVSGVWDNLDAKTVSSFLVLTHWLEWWALVCQFFRKIVNVTTYCSCMP